MEKEDKTKSEANPVLTELATTQDGRDITRPYMQRLEDFRDEIIVQKGNGSLKVFKEVLRDDQVKSTFEQRVKAVVSQSLVVAPGGEEARDKEAADHLRMQLEQIKFDKTVQKMLYGNFYGYAVAEILWKIEDSKVCIDKIKVRDRCRFRFDKERRLRLLTMSNQFDGELLPDRKFWTYAAGADHDDEPYGMGLAHWLYWPVFFKRGGLRLWLKFLDKFAGPTKVGRYHPGATKGERNKLLGALRALEVDSGVAIPENMQIDLLEAKRSGSSDYDKIYERMDKAIAKVVLSQTMTTDDGSSLSQAEVHEGVRDDVAEGDGDLICGSFMESVALWLTDWNYPGAAIPKVSFMDEDEEDLNQAAERDVKLKGLGYELTEEAFVEKYGEGYQRVEAGNNDTNEPGNDNPGNDDTGDFAEEDPDAIDQLTETAVAQTIKHLQKELLGPVLELAEASESYDDFVGKLETIIPEGDTGLIDLMSQTFFMSRAAGLTGLDEND